MRGIAATCALAMLLGVQLFHSPFHHIHCHARAEKPPTTHAHAHCHGHYHTHTHSHSPANETPPCSHGDHACHLCDLAQAPLVCAAPVTLTSAVEPIVVPVTFQSVELEEVHLLPAIARGPPVA